jgi:hypothetical protein
MSLHDAVIALRWDSTHDYSRHDTEGDEIVALYGLGLYESDLEQLKHLVPGLEVMILRRVEHDFGTWLRVDLKEGP